MDHLGILKMLVEQPRLPPWQDLRLGLKDLIAHLEEQEQAQKAQGSQDSSAPTTGTVSRRSESYTEIGDALTGSQPGTPWLSVLMDRISGYSRSMPSTVPELEVTLVPSSTLQLTLRWPTPSGETRDGGRGVADPDYRRARGALTPPDSPDAENIGTGHVHQWRQLDRQQERCEECNARRWLNMTNAQELAVKALKRELGNAEDNLYRAKLQQKASSDWKSGNGESIDEVVNQYQRHRDELAAAVAELEKP